MSFFDFISTFIENDKKHIDKDIWKYISYRKLKRKFFTSLPIKETSPFLGVIKNRYSGGLISIEFEIKPKDELHLLFSFLDYIFMSENKYRIQYCKKCSNFFITLGNNFPCIVLIALQLKLNQERKVMKVLI